MPLLVTRALRFRARAKRTDLWAVRHVDLDVQQGETVGVIGRNGSGKSTMLRMLAGVTAPSEGKVSVAGRVAPLLSVGVGFHQELTGRENVYVNGTILGLGRKEIDDRFDQIVEFAELADFIDTPVKFYSSGMFVRLGFSVAVASRPDVLLIDEVLAVGDFAFQSKCFQRMAEIKSQGTSILVVSHNLNAVRRLCSRTLVLHDGRPRYFGETDAAISLYHDLLTGEAAEMPDASPSDAPAEITEFALIARDGLPTANVEAGDEVAFRIHARFKRDVEEGAFGIQILTSTGETAFAQTNYTWDPRPFMAGDEARCDIRFRAMLGGGSYIARASIRWGGRPHTQLGSSPMHFYVGGRRMVKGIADLDASFEVSAGDELRLSERVDGHPDTEDASGRSAEGGAPIYGGPLSPENAASSDRDPDGTLGTGPPEGPARP